MSNKISISFYVQANICSDKFEKKLVFPNSSRDQVRFSWVRKYIVYGMMKCWEIAMAWLKKGN